MSRRRAQDDRNMSLFAPEPEPVEPHTLTAPAPELHGLYEIGTRCEGIRLQIRAGVIAGEPVNVELSRQMVAAEAQWNREKTRLDSVHGREFFVRVVGDYWRARMARQKEMSCEYE